MTQGIPQTMPGSNVQHPYSPRRTKHGSDLLPDIYLEPPDMMLNPEYAYRSGLYHHDHPHRRGRQPDLIAPQTIHVYKKPRRHFM